MMKLSKNPILILLLGLLLTGCATQAGLANFYAKTQSEYRSANEKIHMASGEKLIRGDQLTIMKGILSGIADLNMSVQTVDHKLGFMSAAGRSVLPGEIEKEILAPILEEYTKGTYVQHNYTPGNYRVVLNVSIYEFADGDNTSKIKLRLTGEVTSQNQIKNNEFPPTLLEAHYRYVWEKLGKHIFIEGETN